MLLDMSFRSRPALSARLGATTAALVALAACAACGSSGSGGGSGGISVVASTNVYGDIVSTIAGPAVKVTSIISDPAQDPHSYQADAKTQLALNRADLVVENGGGYDDFVHTMLDSAGGGATVLNVVDISGRDPSGNGGFNEHVWYDFPTMITLVDRIVSELSRLDAGAASTFHTNGDALKHEIKGLESAAAAIAATSAGAGVAITEPVPLYLLEACGLQNKTPEAFSQAVEEGSDVSPRDLQAMLSILSDGSVRILAYNGQASGPETQQLISAAKRANLAIIPVRETLPAGAHYVAWMRGYLTQIQGALAA